MLKKILTTFAIASTLLIHAQPSSEQLANLRQYYQKALEEWNVPGMSIAIVSNDSIYFSQGFGVTDILTLQKVDEHTLFAVASNTKAFTSSALAMLVDEGKLRWNDKVQQYLPWFQLYDPYVTSEMSVTDLLTHRSGLKTFSGDLIWYGSSYTREEIIRKAKYLKPAHGFREQFGYSNILYLTAGEIIPAITGQQWDDFVKERILLPIGMKRSTLHVKELANRDNIAQPHTYVDGQLKTIPWLDWDNIGPAGSLISSAYEMGLWLQMHLNNGIVGKDTLLSSNRFFEMQSPQTINQVSMGSQKRFPSTHFKAYGLGWSLMDYQGRKIVSHNGGYDGMISQTLFIPEENIGFVILTNSLSSVYYPLMYKTLDVLLENPVEKDWSTEILSLIKAGEQQAKLAQEAEEKQKKEANTKPSLPLSEYTGIYSCPIYDEVEILEEKGNLYLNMKKTPDFQGQMTYYQHNTFKVTFPASPSLPAGFVTFNLDRNSKVSALEIFIDNPDFDFTELELKKVRESE
ncbi:MAG: beta-lactamase [Bacteroidetes bacterium]|nr:MAG: beta-lactamase [Bacteroidota bacterium]